MILTDREISAAIESGQIQIDPEPGLTTPTVRRVVDLTLMSQRKIWANL